MPSFEAVRINQCGYVCAVPDSTPLCGGVQALAAIALLPKSAQATKGEPQGVTVYNLAADATCSFQMLVAAAGETS